MALESQFTETVLCECSFVDRKTNDCTHLFPSVNVGVDSSPFSGKYTGFDSLIFFAHSFSAVKEVESLWGDGSSDSGVRLAMYAVQGVCSRTR